MPIDGLIIGIAYFSFGLVFGSFANVVIWRFPRGESLSHPGSRCPACETPIRWYDNIPVVSWLVLRGRCRECAASISPRYPVVEVLSGLLWLSSFLLYGLSLRSAFAVVFFYLLLILSAIDLDTYRLPNALVGITALTGLAGVGVGMLTGQAVVPLTGDGSPLLNALGGSIASAGLALAIALLYSAARNKQGFGMGDVKLLAAIGLFLGFYGVLVLFVASVVGALFGIMVSTRSAEGLAAKIPLGPFLAFAALLVAAWGPQMWSWYAGLVT